MLNMFQFFKACCFTTGCLYLTMHHTQKIVIDINYSSNIVVDVYEEYKRY